MKIAFIYAGQGSQKVGMGQDFYEEYPEIRSVYDSAPVDFNLKKLSFEGPIEDLSKTEYTQPCMLAMAIAITKLLKKQGIVPEMLAGLSLGEYSALYASGVFDENTALNLISFRGKVMEEAAKGIETQMAAIIGSESALIQNACEEVEKGIVQITNYNCKGQYVVGGEKEAVEAACENILKAAPRSKVVKLNVSGPFHTPLMAPAAEKLKEKFHETVFLEERIPVVYNLTGRTRDADKSIAEMLVEQVKNSVRFEETILFMQDQGIDTMIEIGPGKALSGFVKKTASAIKVYSVEDVNGLREVVKALKGEENE